MSRGDELQSLQAWIKASGFYARAWDDEYEIVFAGNTRDWDIRASLAAGWLILRTYVFEMPELRHERDKLLDLCLRLNDRLAVSKFSACDTQLHLCLGGIL